MMDIYIRSSACISAQHSFATDSLTGSIVEAQTNRLRVIEPDYANYIEHRALRRMSHVIRMGVATAKECLNRAHILMPDAIVVGTAYGCMESSSSFLISMIEREEDDLSPTAFMQSTHNTVAAQIALMLKCHAHNNTFVHKGFSFESAVLDAIMLLRDEEATNVLIGGIDEMTDISFVILERLGMYKRKPVPGLSLFGSGTKGTIGGEGAAFFLLSAQPGPDDLARLLGVGMFYKPGETPEICQMIREFLRQHRVPLEHIDVVLTGKNGDAKGDERYEEVNRALFGHAVRARYKHLCGEYPTSTSFALWLAAGILKTGIIPDVLKDNASQRGKPGHVLIYNCYLGSFHTLMLVSTAGR